LISTLGTIINVISLVPKLKSFPGFTEFAFKFNLYRYTESIIDQLEDERAAAAAVATAAATTIATAAAQGDAAVGLSTLNPVRPHSLKAPGFNP
jgi:hypothetical protein